MYSASDVFFAATTDSRSWRGEVIETERRAEQTTATGKAPTWVYQLDWATPVDGGKWKAPHTLDIPLLFANTALSPRMTGDGSDAREMAARMSHMLVVFARTGIPNGKGLPEWPKFDLKQRRTMIFDRLSQVVSDPRGEERRYLSQVPYTQPGT
jgi:para-nitrobenzyl esterase